MRQRYWGLSRMMTALSGYFMQGTQQRLRLDQAALLDDLDNVVCS